MSVDDPLRPPTLLTYDPFGHVRTVTDPDSNLTDFGYTGGQFDVPPEIQAVLNRVPGVQLGPPSSVPPFIDS